MDCIKKIELDLDGKVVVLTPKQAKKLRESLNELFGKKVKGIHHYDHYRWFWDYQPYYQPSTPYMPYYSPITVSGDSTGIYTDCSSVTFSAGTLRLTA